MATFKSKKRVSGNTFFKPNKGGSKKNRSAEIYSVESLADDGRGIARPKGKTTFINNALPGEQVKASVFIENKKHNEAELIEVITPSAFRVKANCEHYDKCGGCQLQHLEYSQQVEYLFNNFQFAINRQLPSSNQPIVFHPPIVAQSLQYRHRIRLSLDIKQAVVGFKQQKSRKITRIKQCLLADKAINNVIASLQSVLPQLPAATKIDECLIEIGDIDASSTSFAAAKPQLLFLVKSELSQLEQHAFTQIKSLMPDVDCAYQVKHAASGNDLPLMMFNSINNISLRYAITDFTQVNKAVNALMLTKAIALLQVSPSDVLMDLFCGMGNISLPMAQQLKYVYGYEYSRPMVALAAANAEFNHLTNCRFFTLDLHKPAAQNDWLKCAEENAVNLLVLDPPRSGAEQVCEAIADSLYSFDKILYISCNLQTQLRDIALLMKGGYQLKDAVMMDMFPQTAHTESMLLLQKSN